MAVFLDQWEKSEYSSQTRSILAVSISFFLLILFVFLFLLDGLPSMLFSILSESMLAKIKIKDKHETKEEKIKDDSFFICPCLFTPKRIFESNIQHYSKRN